MFTESQHRVHESSEKVMPLVNLLCSNPEFNRVICRIVTLASENRNKRVLRVGRGFVHKKVVNAWVHRKKNNKVTEIQKRFPQENTHPCCSIQQRTQYTLSKPALPAILVGKRSGQDEWINLTPWSRISRLRDFFLFSVVSLRKQIKTRKETAECKSA